MDALKKERPMSLDDNGMNFLSGNTDWRAKYNEVVDMLAETKTELDEFHHASKELEAELEAELARTEKSQQDLQIKVSRAESERDDWKSKFMSLQTAHNTTTTSLQRELDRLRQEYQQLKVQLRELEMGNDDLERNERAVSSSLADMETKYSRVLEEKILLEQELLEKVSLEEGTQRLKDELRDANEEVSMLKNRLTEATTAAEKAAADARQLRSRMPPPPTDGLKTGPPPDLELADLAPSTGTTSQVTTPKANGFNRSASHSVLQRSSVQNRESPLGNLKSSRSATSGTVYSPGSSTGSRLPSRVTPIRSLASVASFSSTSTTSTTSKNKGVQMVSEMRARVRNLEQKIHTRVPRLRMASIAGRSSMSSNVSSVPSVSGSSSPLSNASTAKTSWESQRPSPDPSRQSSESFDKQSKKDNGESGWVLIMEDSPSPAKDKERERKERRRLSNPSAPTSFRSTRAPSPSLSTGPPSSFLGKSTGLRRPVSRSSNGGGSGISGLSRPTSPTLLPMPTGNYGLKRSTGPNGPNPYSNSQTKRPSLGSSANAGSPDARRRTTVHPPLPIADFHSDDKGLPDLPPSLNSSSITVRGGKSNSSNSASTMLSKSRIGKPSGRKSGGGGDLDINDLRPRSGSFFGL
ncbi:hypothetical protein MD484_g19, partial [Candolleomyces efflorescens]